MSVYIRGMEMPTSCYNCPLCEQTDFYASPYCRIFDDDYMMSINEMRSKRRDNCPLIPIPPHGRLIESAELYGKAEDIKTKAMSVCDKPQSWQFGVFWAIEQIEAALTNAPTIIEAEEGNG